ncbi:hypothetical protein INR49_016263 [Caranx melampygus]|nr:hypothetical protein INR49_016263 [Caranx melampygus]
MMGKTEERRRKGMRWEEGTRKTELEEEKKDETPRRDPMKRSTDLRTMTRLNHKAVKMSPEAGSTYSSRTLENFLAARARGGTSCGDHRSFDPKAKLLSTAGLSAGTPEASSRRHSYQNKSVIFRSYEVSLGPDVVSESSCFHSCKTQVHRVHQLQSPKSGLLTIRSLHHQSQRILKPNQTLFPLTVHQLKIRGSSCPQPSITTSYTVTMRLLIQKSEGLQDMKTSRCGKISRPPGAPRVIRYTVGRSLSTA